MARAAKRDHQPHVDGEPERRVSLSGFPWKWASLARRIMAAREDGRLTGATAELLWQQVEALGDEALRAYDSEAMEEAAVERIWEQLARLAAAAPLRVIHGGRSPIIDLSARRAGKDGA